MYDIQAAWNEDAETRRRQVEGRSEQESCDDTKDNSLESIAGAQQSAPLFKESPQKKNTYDGGDIGAVIHFSGWPVFGAGLMQFMIRMTKPYLSEDMPRWMPESLIAAGLGLAGYGLHLVYKSVTDEQVRNRERIRQLYEKYPGDGAYAHLYKLQSGKNDSSKSGDKHVP